MAKIGVALGQKGAAEKKESAIKNDIKRRRVKKQTAQFSIPGFVFDATMEQNINRVNKILDNAGQCLTVIEKLQMPTTFDKAMQTIADANEILDKASMQTSVQEYEFEKIFGNPEEDYGCVERYKAIESIKDEVEMVMVMKNFDIVTAYSKVLVK